MNKNEYINRVCEKIFDLNTKKAVSAELLQHIDEKADFYAEIGYDSQVSEAKATEDMGDTDEICEQFGQLHNDFYNPVPDIILLAVMLAVFGAVYYLLKKFAFGDAGLTSAVLGSSCLSFALTYGYCFLAIKRNKLFPLIFSFVSIIATGVFNYFILIEADKLMGQSVKNLIDFIMKTEIRDPANYPNEEKITGVILALLLFAFLSAIFSVIYFIRVKKLVNTKTDNRIKNFFTRVCMVMFAFSAVCSILFGVKTYFDLNKIKQEYYDAYSYVLTLSEKCSTREEITDFIDKNNYDFVRITNYEGELTGYSYKHNLTQITVSFNDIESKEEIRAEYAEDLENYKDEIREFLSEVYDSQEEIDRFYNRYIDLYTEYFTDRLNNSVERDYYNQLFCTVTLEPVLKNFGNSLDSFSLSFIELKNGEEDILYQPDIADFSEKEKYNLYKNIAPYRLNIDFSLSEIESCMYDYAFVTGEKNFKMTDDRLAVKVDEKTEEFYTQFNEAYEIISKNKEASNYEIAKLTGADIEEPEMSKEEFEDSVSFLGTRFDSLIDRALENYDLRTSYHFDNWYFILSGMPYEEFYVYDKYNNFITSKRLSDFPNMINFNGSDGQKKVRINGGYYDKLGYFYPQPDNTPYYTADGKRYYFCTKTIKDETHTVGDTKEYYITDRKYTFYKPDNCYIDTDGYICFNNSGYIKYDKNSGTYKSADGSKYTKAFETSWDKDGNPILQNDNYETTESLF